MFSNSFLMPLINGVIVAVAVEAPIGPIAILTANRTLARGFKAGLATGMGSATALSVFSLIVGTSYGLVIVFFQQHQAYFRIAGSILMVIMGLTMVLSAGRKIRQTIFKSGTGDYASAFLVAVSNPQTMVYFLAVFAGFGLGNHSENKLSIIFLVAGAFIGSVLWWCGLSFLFNHLRKSVSAAAGRALLCFSGFLMAAAGLILFIKNALL